MIISHKYKFIFIKTFKTASSSFEEAFSYILGPDDILTLDNPPYKGVQSQNCEGTDFFNHMHGIDIKKLVSPQAWDSYYKFCIERNSWDKAVSWYYWELGRESASGPISKYVLNSLPLPDWPFYTVDDKVIVDKILRSENLPAEIARLERRLGLPKLNMQDIRVKGNTRPKVHYRDVLGEPQKEKIASIFCKTIELMGYTF